MESRRASASVVYQGKNITADIAGDLTSVSYEEGFGRADIVTLRLQDRNNKWLLSWKPQTGDSLQIGIHAKNWMQEGDNQKLLCGKFLVDNLEYIRGSSGAILNLGGNSLPSNTSFIGTPRSRTWSSVTLKDQILSMLPKGLTLNWQTKFNINLAYAEQSETADLEYIQNQCAKYGLRLKVLNNRLTVFGARELDTQPPVRTFQLPEPSKDISGNLASITLRHTTTRTQYDACTVKYQNASQGQEITYTYPHGGSQGKIYEITEAVYSIAEAEAVAKAALWEQNIASDVCEIELAIGDTALYAGRNIALEGAGDFDGIYGIDSSAHVVSESGYTTALVLHRVIVNAAKEQTQDIKIGDTVNFSGGYHYYTSVDGTPVGGVRTAGTAKVTNIAAAAPHPYHLIGATSNVYGWVDASTVSKG